MESVTRGQMASFIDIDFLPPVYREIYQQQLSKARYGTIATEIVGPPAPTFFSLRTVVSEASRK